MSGHGHDGIVWIDIRLGHETLRLLDDALGKSHVGQVFSLGEGLCAAACGGLDVTSANVGEAGSAIVPKQKDDLTMMMMLHPANRQSPTPAQSESSGPLPPSRALSPKTREASLAPNPSCIHQPIYINQHETVRITREDTVLSVTMSVLLPVANTIWRPEDPG